jgi:hypothetical protein
VREESARYDAGRTPVRRQPGDGFLVNRLGEITWDGMTNVWHLIIFALALAGTTDTSVLDKKEALRG